jgi:hypothetical protein
MFDRNGGSDGARTRDLRRDRPTIYLAISRSVPTFFGAERRRKSVSVGTPHNCLSGLCANFESTAMFRSARLQIEDGSRRSERAASAAQSDAKYCRSNGTAAHQSSSRRANCDGGVREVLARGR